MSTRETAVAGQFYSSKSSEIKATLKQYNQRLDKYFETHLEIKMPLVTLKKSQIVSKSIEMKVRLEDTWSCYKSEDSACGLCDSCRLRLRGFKQAKAIDPILYDDNIRQ